MNAIERLRAEVESPKFRREDAADWKTAAEALAAVDALHQAAKDVVGHDLDETEGREHLYALAAAVRRVEEGA